MEYFCHEGFKACVGISLNKTSSKSTKTHRIYNKETNYFQLLFMSFVQKARKDCVSSGKHATVCVQKKNQLDVTKCIIALMICSTCFGYFCSHHQELETICVLLPPVVCSAWLLVVGVRCRAASYASRKRNVQRRATSLFLDSQPAVLYPNPDNQQPSTAHHRQQ